MNIRNKKSHLSQKIAWMCAALAVLGVGTYLVYSLHIWPFNDTPHQSIQDAANSSDATNPQQKQNIPSTESLKGNGVDKTTNEIPAATGGTLEITKLSQQNGLISYAADLSGIQIPGTCSALFENVNKAARPVTRVTKSTTTGCPETSIPETEFVALGRWTLTLRYYVNDSQLVATKTIEVK
jgi:hypothetical protein